jgi:glycosyltransferase involved in cell wall biosynthesis
MRIWLAQTGEEMPSDGSSTRLLRTCLLARELAARGHEVIYCNSTFSHQKKIQRYDRTTRIRQPHGYDCVFLYGRGYAKNIGLRRILSHRDNAREFRNWARTQPLPHVVHCGFPPIELAAEAARFAQAAGVPSTVDCRDIWPEIIEDRLPPAVRWLAAPVLGAWERSKREAMRSATAITGVSEGFLAWGLGAAGRPQSPLDVAFHLATPPEAVHEGALNTARQHWRAILGDMPKSSLVVCYAGTFSRRFDFPAILEGMDLLTPEEKAKVRLVLCGAGDMETEIKRRASINPSIVYGGWSSRPQLAALMEIASAGLLPYPNSLDFLVTFPNKVGEYLTAGLPILTGTKGAVEELLAPDSLKIGYTAGDSESFAASIRSLLSRANVCDMREKARDLAKAQFDPQKIYSGFADWIEMVARTGRMDR